MQAEAGGWRAALRYCFLPPPTAYFLPFHCLLLLPTAYFATHALHRPYRTIS